MDADIALVVQTERLSLNFAAYQRLLGAGINVICHGSESYFPQGADPDLAEKIDALAKSAKAPAAAKASTATKTPTAKKTAAPTRSATGARGNATVTDLHAAKAARKKTAAKTTTSRRSA